MHVAGFEPARENTMRLELIPLDQLGHTCGGLVRGPVFCTLFSLSMHDLCSLYNSYA